MSTLMICLLVDAGILIFLGNLLGSKSIVSLSAAYKTCPKCTRRNPNTSQICDRCGEDISAIYAANINNTKLLIGYIRALGLIVLISSVIGAVYCVVSFSYVTDTINNINTSALTSTYNAKKTFSILGISYGAALLFGGMFLHAIMLSIAALLSKE